MEELAKLYFVILPLVLAAALAEGLWLSRRREQSYDWKSWGCSLADLVGRRILAFIPYTFAAPWLGWVWEHRVASQSLAERRPRVFGVGRHCLRGLSSTRRQMRLANPAG